MNARERFLSTLHYQKPDRLPLYEWIGFWSDTVNRWHGEGLPIGVNLGNINDYFGFDRRERVPVGLWSPIPGFKTRTIEENERVKLEVAEAGSLRAVTKTLKTSMSMPQFLEFPVKNRMDYEEMKRRLDPHDLRRYPDVWSDGTYPEEVIRYYESVDYPIGIGMYGFFGKARDWMGLERLLITFYKDPDWVHDMFKFFADFKIEVARNAVEQLKIDYAVFWEDMAYKNGPHISPRLFQEFMQPYYKRVTEFLRRNDVDIIMVDSDGDINLLAPLFLEAGVNCIYPLEAQANVDGVTLRKRHGRQLLLIGNIDKRVLPMGKEAIEKELERVLPLIKEGGYIPSIDHNVPSDVPYDNYLYYVNALKRYAHEV